MRTIYCLLILFASWLVMGMSRSSQEENTIESYAFYNYLNEDTLKVLPSWKSNRIIIGNPKNPVGLIGVYNKNIPLYGEISDVKQVIEFLDFPVTDSMNFLTTSALGFKVLNTSPELYRSPKQFWNNFNRPWLLSLVDSNSVIYVLSDSRNDLLRYNYTKAKDSCIVSYGSQASDYQLMRTGFGNELEFMDSLVSVGSYCWDEALGAYKSKK